MNYNKNLIWKIKLLNNYNSNYKINKWKYSKCKKNKQITVAIQEINNHLIKNYPKVKIMKKIKLFKN